jgi:hypothetical protein
VTKRLRARCVVCVDDWLKDTEALRDLIAIVKM